MHTHASMFLRFGTGAALLLGAALMSGGCVDTAADGQADQALLGGHSLSDVRFHYGVTGMGTLSTTVAIVSVHDYANMQSDANAARAASSLPAIALTKFGSSTPDALWGKRTAIALQLASAGCPSCNYLYFGANSASSTDIRLAINSAASMLVSGGEILVVPAISETDAEVPNIQSIISSNPSVLFVAPAGKTGALAEYPAASPQVVSVSGTEFTTGIDLATSGSLDACSTVFARQPFEATLCGTKRMTADISSVARDLQITFNGVTALESNQLAAAGFVTGRIALNPTPVTLRSQVLGASPTFRLDVTTGTDGAGHVAGPGIDLATGFGVPQGNQTF